LRGSDLERPFHGVRSASESRASIQAFCRAYLPRLRPGQFFSHWTAAQLWLAPLPVPFDSSENLHVSTTAPNRAPRARFVTGHQVTDPLASVHTRFELPTADPATTWLQLAPTLSESNLVAVADHLVLTPVYAAPPERRPYLTLDELARRAYAYRGPGSKRARASLLRVRQGAESRPETLVRLTPVCRSPNSMSRSGGRTASGSGGETCSTSGGWCLSSTTEISTEPTPSSMRRTWLDESAFAERTGTASTSESAASSTPTKRSNACERRCCGQDGAPDARGRYPPVRNRR
jgi:hypothetical protein